MLESEAPLGANLYSIWHFATTEELTKLIVTRRLIKLNYGLDMTVSPGTALYIKLKTRLGNIVSALRCWLYTMALQALHISECRVCLFISWSFHFFLFEFVLFRIPISSWLAFQDVLKAAARVANVE